MLAAEPSPRTQRAVSDPRDPEAEPSGFTLARLAWLIRLRWLALLGIVIATGLAASGAVPGVNWPVLAITATLAAAYNALLYFETRRGVADTGQRAVMPQALADFLLLTVVLWAAGGVRSPFLGFYTFHVVLLGILAGARATLLAGGAALMSTALLATTERFPALRIGEWNPIAPWDLVTDIAAFASTVLGVAYLVVHAVGELRDRERALHASETLAERQLMLAERLASLGRTAQGVAHELNTPLATIRTLASDMVVALRDGQIGHEHSALVKDIGESATLIREETARLGRITQALLAGGDLTRARVDGAVPISAVVERACALVFAGVRKGATVRIDPTMQGLHAVADHDRLVQVLVNLLQNAHDAVRTQVGGHVAVSAQRNAMHAIEIRVDDDGVGLPQSVRDHLFEPFTTTKPPGEGTGLGLYTSYMLVKSMHGSLSLSAAPNGGTRATVILPAAAELNVDAHAPAEHAAAEPMKETSPDVR